MRTSSNQYFIYMVFAAISIILNLVSQYIAKVIIVFLVPNFANQKISHFEYWFLIALGFGTVIGFLFKFVVDKFVVFEEKLSEDTRAELQKTTKQISMYFGFAIFTTIIFWGFEFSFKFFLPGNWYLFGGLIGLIVGYTVKFLLDSRFVFNKDPESLKS